MTEKHLTRPGGLKRRQERSPGGEIPQDPTEMAGPLPAVDITSIIVLEFSFAKKN
jgi:hypothetical protein